MIKTRIVEAYADNLGKINERELGWCVLPEVPIEKKQPTQPPPGQPLPTPMAIKVNGTNYVIIGHSWDIVTKMAGLGVEGGCTLTEDQMGESVLVIIVQAVPVNPMSGLVKAPASALDMLDRRGPVVGGKKLS